MADLVQRTTRMGIVPAGEIIEGAGQLMPVAFMPRYVPKLAGVALLTGGAMIFLLHALFPSRPAPGYWVGMMLAFMFLQMVGLPTRYPDQIPGARPMTGIAGSFPKEEVVYVATDQRLLAVRLVKPDGFRRDRRIVASVPWTDVVGVSANNRQLWTLFTFTFADGTLLTLSRGRLSWLPGGLAYAVNIRASAPHQTGGLPPPR
jgi:hypothetical protein